MEALFVLSALALITIVGHGLWLFAAYFVRTCFGRRWTNAAARELADLEATERSLLLLQDHAPETATVLRRVRQRREEVRGTLVAHAPAEPTRWLRIRPRELAVATYFAGAACIALLSFVALPDRGPASWFHAAWVYGAFGLLGLLLNARWRQPWVGSASLALVVAGSLWGLGWMDRESAPPRFALWSAALAGEALLLATGAWFASRRGDAGRGEVLARTAEGTTPLACVALLWAAWTTKAWVAEYVLTTVLLMTALALLAVRERNASLARLSGWLLLFTSFATAGFVAKLLAFPRASELALHGAAAGFAALIAALVSSWPRRRGVRHPSSVFKVWRETARAGVVLALGFTVGSLAFGTSAIPTATAVLLLAECSLLARSNGRSGVARAASCIALGGVAYLLLGLFPTAGSNFAAATVRSVQFLAIVAAGWSVTRMVAGQRPPTAADITLALACILAFLPLSVACVVFAEPGGAVPWASASAAWPGWLAFLLTAAARFVLIRTRHVEASPHLRSRLDEAAWWGLGLIGMAASSVHAWQGTWGFHFLFLSLSAYALAWSVAGWLVPRRMDGTSYLADGWRKASAFWVNVIGVAVTVLVVKAALVHEARGLAILALASVALAALLVRVNRATSGWSFHLYFAEDCVAFVLSKPGSRRPPSPSCERPRWRGAVPSRAAPDKPGIARSPGAINADAA